MLFFKFELHETIFHTVSVFDIHFGLPDNIGLSVRKNHEGLTSPFNKKIIYPSNYPLSFKYIGTLCIMHNVQVWFFKFSHL